MGKTVSWKRLRNLGRYPAVTEVIVPTKKAELDEKVRFVIKLKFNKSALKKNQRNFHPIFNIQRLRNVKGCEMEPFTTFPIRNSEHNTIIMRIKDGYKKFFIGILIPRNSSLSDM